MRKLNFVLCFLFILISLYSININIEKAENFSLNKENKISLNISSADRIEEISIFYKTNLSTFYLEEELIEAISNKKYIHNFEFSNVNLKSVEYYFQIKTEDQTIFYPQNNPKLNPLRTTVTLPNFNDSFILLSDLKTEDKKLSVVISYFHIQNIIERNSIKFFLDGKDISGRGKATENLFVLNDFYLEDGEHSFYIEAKTINNKKIRSKNWTFTSAKVRKIADYKQSGKVYLKNDYDSKDKGAKFNSKLYLNYKIYGEKISAVSNFTVSSKEKKNEQSVNKYALGIFVPHLDLRFGDYSTNYSKFSLNNVNSRGFHTNLYFKYFRFMTSFGNSYRKTDGNISADELIEAGTFERKQIAFRIETGSMNSFNWGLSFAKSKDDKNSLDEKYYQAINDSTLEKEIKIAPVDNIVLSTDFTLSLYNNRIVWNSEIATSLYNSNILPGSYTKEELEDSLGIDTPFDPESFEDIFVFNSNVSPTIPSMSSVSINSNLRTFIKKNLFIFSYSRVGNAFNSLSSYSLQNDLQTISLTDNITLYNNQIFITTGLKLSHNNLSDNNFSTNSSSNFFIQTLFNLQQYPQLNISFSKSASKNEIDENEDDSEYDFTTIYISTNKKIDLLPTGPTRFNIAFSSNSSGNNNSDLYSTNSNTININTTNYYDNLPLETRIGYSIGFNEYDKKYKNHSMNLSSNMKLLDNKVLPYFNYRYTKSDYSEDSESLNTFILGSDWFVRSNFKVRSNIVFDKYTEENKISFNLNLRYKF